MIDRRTLLAAPGALLAGLATPGLADGPSVDIVELESRTLGPRHLLIYRPPGWRADGRYAVIYAADGQTLNEGYAWALDGLIREGKLRPTVMVGLWSGELKGVGDTRALEYLDDGEDGGRAFRRHELYFLDEVVPFVEARYAASPLREDRLLFGFSNGAAWAAAMGLRHRERFGQAALFSFGWRPAGDGAARADRPRLFLLAGDREPHFLAETRRLYALARQSPAEVELHVANGEHGRDLWRPAFPDAALWAFGAKAKG